MNVRLPVIIAVLGATAHAAVAADGAGALLACRAVAERDARLACFDRESARLAEATPTGGAVPAAPTEVHPPAPIPPTTPVPPAADAALFGRAPAERLARIEAAAGAREAQALQARLAAIALRDDGKRVFTLDNGQVWRQLQPDGDLLAHLGEAVTIGRGALGSFHLTAASGRSSKVTRVE